MELEPLEGFLLALTVCVVAVIMKALLLERSIPIRQVCKGGSCIPTPSSSSSTLSISNPKALEKDQIISENLEWTKIQRKLEQETNDLRNLLESCRDIHLRCERMERHIQELRRGIEPLVRCIDSTDDAPALNAVAVAETPTVTSELKPSRRRPKLYLSHLKPKTEDHSKSVPPMPSSSPSSRKRSSKSSRKATLPRDILQAFTSDLCFYVQEEKAALVSPSRLKLSRLDSVDERSCALTLANTPKVSSLNVAVSVNIPGESTTDIWHPISVRDAKSPETTNFKILNGIKVTFHPSTRKRSIGGRR